MISLILSITWSVLYLIQITVLFNIIYITEKAKFMIKLWVINLPILIICYFMIAYKFMPSSYLIGGIYVNLILTIFLYSAGFFGGILQLYNLADRGFSLRILIDIQESEQKAMTLENIMTGYSRGKGISWMYKKRVDNMLTNGLIFVSDNIVGNTFKGKQLSKWFIKLRKIFNLD